MSQNRFRYGTSRLSNGALVSVVVALLFAIGLTVTVLGLPGLRDVVAGAGVGHTLS